MDWWTRLARAWQEQNAKDAEHGVEGKHDVERIHIHGSLEDAVEDNNELWSLTCILCAEVHFVNEADVAMCRNGLFHCRNCGKPDLFHVSRVGSQRPAKKTPKYSEQAIEREMHNFEVQLAWWLRTDEGKKAELDAQYDPRGPWS